MVKIPKLRKGASTPTRQVTGTSYTASGAPNIKAPTLNELGSSASSILPDPVPDVGNRATATRTYLKMVRDDASIRVSLRAGKAPVLGAEWYIEPFDNSDQSLAVAEFVDFNFFHGMTVPWLKVLEQVLTFYEASLSVFEPVWEMREWAPKQTTSGANRRQYTMLRKLAFRPATTLGKFNYDDNGGLLGVEHTAINATGQSTQVPLPIEKLIIFAFDQQGGTIESSISILRSAYKHWYYKDRLYAIDAIQKERHGIGVPDIEVGAGASPEDRKLAHIMGQNLKTNEFAYIVRPPSIKVGFAELKGQLVNALESAEHHDNMIMKNIMVQFLNLGTGVTGGGGGRSTGATSMDMFLKSMRHVSNTIAESINLYLIPNLVAYNFPTDQFPQLKVRNVGEVKDLQMWSAAMRNLISENAITVDEATENWIRNQMDMPKLTTPWVPIEQRAVDVIETEKGPLGNATPTPAPSKNGDKSSNGGAGNIGVSPSSGG